MKTTKTLPQVHMLALGGTIAMTPDASGGVTPNLTGSAILGMVPEAADIAHVQASSFRQVASAHLTLADHIDLVQHIRNIVHAGADGIVITQGTDTIEETAFALDMLLDCDVPVVVTGAMRNPGVAGADGAANLLAAIRVAACPQAKGAGVLVAFNDTIHAGRFVRKCHTTVPSAFRSVLIGPIGWVAEGKVRVPVKTTPGSLPLPRLETGVPVPDVALMSTWIGDDGKLVHAALKAGYEGIVMEGFGGGHVTPAVADALEQAAHKIPVIIASRTGDGEILQNTYGFTGSEIDLGKRGVLFAGILDGTKTRLLLSILLMHGIKSPPDIQDAINRLSC